MSNIDRIINHQDGIDIVENLSRIAGNTPRIESLEINASVLAARMDEFTHLEEGSTTGDAELIDGRVGADGVIYSNIGTANRTQFTDIKSDMDGVVKDLIPLTIVPDSYVVRSDGSFAPYTGWSRTDYFEVDPTKTLWVQAPARSQYNACYDENKTFIRAFAFEVGLSHVEMPANTKYVVLSGENSRFPLRVFTEIEKPYQTAFDTIVKSDAPLGIMPLTGWNMGTIDSTSGELTLTWKQLTSDYIPIVGGTTLYADFLNMDYGVLITEYDSNKAFVRQKPQYINQSRDRYWTVAANTAFVRLTVANTDNFNVTPDDAMKFGISLKVVPLAPVSRVKVMTYNLGHYNYGTGVGLPADIYDEKLMNYRRFFGNEAPEIIGAQEFDSKMDEANTIWANDVLWNHLYPYTCNTGMQTALKSKMLLSDSKNDTLSTGRYYTEGWVGGVYVLSVHLSVGTGNTQTRLNEADEIISNLLNGKDKFILFGDFNPEPGEEDALYKKFTDAGYNIANCGWFGKYYTWSNNRADFDDYDNPQGTQLYYLDNIITSANINIANVYPIPEAYDKLSSDHIPLVAELEL